MTSAEWVASFLVHEDDGKAAEAMLNDLGRQSVRVRSLLYPILKDEARLRRRQVMSASERTIPVDRVFSEETSLDARRSRLEATFALADGRRVSWAEATINDHQQRIAFLQTHIAGVERTIREHERAIETIVGFGVNCLGEIEVVA